MKMQAFLKAWDAGPSSVDMEELIAGFQQAMDKGLKGEESSMAMIPAFVDVPESIPSGKPVIVLDAGGTNFRTCLVTFDFQGRPVFSHWKRSSMPGIEREVSAKEFFSAFADQVEPLVDQSDLIGFCYSYAASIAPDGDGTTLRFSKEIKAPEVIGLPVGKSLLDELARRGHDVSKKKVVIVNDTVATLLAGAAELPGASAYLGLILGTGTNMAYLEQSRNILKLKNPRLKRQVINTESGNYDVPAGRLGGEFISTTNDPEHYHLEKMTSGAYLGGQWRMLVRHAIDQGFFSDHFSSRFLQLPKVTTIMLSSFLSDPTEGEVASCVLNDSDRENLLELGNAVVEKAAKLAAGELASVIRRLPETDKPVCVNVDGTTFYRTKGLQEACKAYLSEALPGRKIKLVHLENSPTVGAAIAGLS